MQSPAAAYAAAASLRDTGRRSQSPRPADGKRSAAARAETLRRKAVRKARRS